MQKYANIYYFRHINKLGGIEEFFYQLAKKYKDKDLAILYISGDKNQINRLKKYVRCIQYTGQKLECERAFFNFNMEISDEITANEKVLVIHGNYKDLNCLPVGWEKMDRIVAVSNDSAKAFEELTGRKVEVCYNPFTPEEVKPVINCVVASRLYDEVKGAGLLMKIIKKMDTYCQGHNRQYNMTIFSDIKENISDNVSFRNPRLDIQPYLASADLVFQLSKSEGFGYTTCIAQSYGTKCVLTPCPVYKELGITNAIWLNFDGSNVDEVVEKIFNENYEKKPYKLPSDRWEELLVDSKSTYKKEEYMEDHLVKVIKQYNDNELCKKKLVGDEFYCTKNRYEQLIEKPALVELIRIEKKEEPKKEPTKKTTKKK